jgi:hypothetical protein
MATVATRREKKTLSNEKNKRTDLTPTGLLMEGHFAQNPLGRGILSAIEIFQHQLFPPQSIRYNFRSLVMVVRPMKSAIGDSHATAKDQRRRAAN